MIHPSWVTVANKKSMVFKITFIKSIGSKYTETEGKCISKLITYLITVRKMCFH